MNTYFVIALLFGIAISLYLLGFESPFMTVVNSQNYTNLVNQIMNYVFNPMTLISIVGMVAAASSALNFNILAIIPFALLTVLLPFLLVPSIPAGVFDPMISGIINAFFILMFTLVIVSFLRSG